MIKLILFLLFELLFVLLLVFLNRTHFNNKLTNVKIALFSTLFFYISLLTVVFIIKYTLKKELDSFDLNGDDNFSIEEKTSEQQNAMRAVISDTGRNLAPLIGLLYSFIYFVSTIIALQLFNRNNKKATN